MSVRPAPARRPLDATGFWLLVGLCLVMLAVDGWQSLHNLEGIRRERSRILEENGRIAHAEVELHGWVAVASADMTSLLDLERTPEPENPTPARRPSPRRFRHPPARSPASRSGSPASPRPRTALHS